MQLAVRSYLAAGVAIAGVGALAVSPVAPPMPDVAVPAIYSSAAVELSALVNPFEEYAVAFNVALQNAAALAERIAENPTPILSQIVANQLRGAAGIATFVGAFGESVVSQLVLLPEQLGVAAGQLADGNVTQALNTVLNAALAPIVQAVVDTLLFNPEVYTAFQEALAQPFTNLLNVINLTSYPNVLNLLGPLLAPVQVLTDVTNAVGAAGDGVVSGFRNGNLEEVANALLSLGPDVTYALLNGSPVSPDFSAGLLGPQGIFAGLLTLRDMVAAAITPPAAAGLTVADAALDTTATTVTLEVADGLEPAPEGAGVPEAQPISQSDTSEAVDPAPSEAGESVTAPDADGSAPDGAVTPAEESPATDAPSEQTPSEETSTEETPAEETPTDDASADDASDDSDAGAESEESASGQESGGSSEASDSSGGSDSDSGSSDSAA